MKKIVLLLMLALFAAALPAQQRKGSGKAPSAQQKTVRKKTTPAKKTTPVKKSTPKKTGTPVRQQNKQQKSPTVKGLQNERKELQAKRAANQRKQEELKRGVKQGMENLMILDQEIAQKRRVVDTIRNDIDQLTSYIGLLDRQLIILQEELEERRTRYMKSLRYMHRHRSAQDQLMFVFSADNFNQMYRRLRFSREYAAYQRAQGEAVKLKRQQVEEKKRELAESRHEKNTLLERGEREKKLLEGKQNEQKVQVNQLKKQQKTVEALILEQQRREEELNARIDQLIAEEIAREKARIEAEKKRKAEELARKERERQEQERRLAEAKAREEKAKAEALAAKTAKEKAAAKQRQLEAENDRKTAERHVEESKKAISDYTTSNFTNADPDQKLSGSFASNKGHLPMPITGAYQVVRGFGSNVVDGMKNVHLSSKGLHLKGQPGAKARCVFDGVVSKIYSTGNSYIVMVRHGKYISVYCDLASVSVAAGQKVSTNQTLGALGSNNTMQFQLRNWTELLNPRPWLRR